MRSPEFAAETPNPFASTGSPGIPRLVTAATAGAQDEGSRNASPPPGGALWPRIVPMFETASEKNAWLNNVVAVGVYRPDLGKIAYRVYRIL